MDDLLTDELRKDRNDSHFDRVDALLDAAQDHLQNKRPEQAMAIWRQLIEERGEGSDDAFVAHVDYLVRHALNDEEESRLEAEMADGPVSRLTRFRAATLLERRGQLVRALRWYSAETDQLTADEVRDSPWAKLMVTGRRRVKWALGMELDAIDLLGDAGEVEAEDNYFDMLDLLRAPTIIRGRVQVWGRAEFAVAFEHWPARITVDSVEAYYRAVEGVLRQYDQQVTVFHLTFGYLTDCIDALDELHRSELPGNALQDEAPGVPWPPERNQPCWCGSDKTYKKCCGMGGLPSGPQQAWGPAGLRSGAQLAVCRVSGMADEEFRVVVELGSDEHGLSFWERLRALDLDDDARKRLGNQVTVTRDGNRMLLYTHTLEDAREAERTAKELVADDNLSAEYTVTRWNPAEQEWTDPSAPVGEHDAAGDAAKNADVEVPDPRYVVMQAYKPEFLRDLGL